LEIAGVVRADSQVWPPAKVKRLGLAGGFLGIKKAGVGEKYRFPRARGNRVRWYVPPRRGSVPLC
jgi:hypothetical protein